MRYKITGIILAIVILMLSLFVPLVAKRKSNRVWQHQLAVEKKPCTHKEGEIVCTHLPLVIIDTEGVEIPGKILKESWETINQKMIYSTAADGEKTIEADMKIVDNEETMNHPHDTYSLDTRINIRIRGDDSRRFRKKGYELRLIKEDGTNNPLEMMGMDAHHEWVMHGPFLDKTLMRNYISYNIAGEMMDYAPNVRFCELILNGEYQGVYVMTESITAGKDGARLTMDVSKSGQTYTGYLLRLDNYPQEDKASLNNFTDYTMRTSQQIEIYYPGKTKMTEEMKRSINNDFSSFEKALYSYDYDSKDFGYDKYIDVESFVDYFLLNELTYNGDAGSKSTYIYKDTNNRYHMCVWDFNNAFDNYRFQMGYEGFFMVDAVWFKMLLKDEDFVKQIVERYYALRENYFDEAYLMNCIDNTDAYLGDAVNRNFEVWDDDLSSMYQYNRDCGNHEEEVEKMKIWLHNRLQWLDENIETLYQYSAESAVKKYNDNPE